MDVSGRFNDILLIFLLAMVFLGTLIANPGYFNHDELQKMDHVIRYGIGGYIDHYVTIYKGTNFGVPVRPVSFFVQGIQSLGMVSYPFLVHLSDVITHAVVATLLYLLAVQFGTQRSVARTIAIVFLLNPLTILATGWSAALMDRWYVLFGLICLLYADKYIRGKSSNLYLFFVLASSALAVLSKETAMILPGLLIVVWFVDREVVKNRRFWIAAGIWFLPIAIFMLHRFSAIITSFSGSETGAYSASIVNVPESLLVYISYPFLPTLNEAVNWVFIPEVWLVLGIAFHIIVVVFFSRIYGRITFPLYWVMFLLFILPVVTIPNKGGHYLYGSALPLSIIIAFLLHQKMPHRLIYKAIGVLAFVVLGLHSILLQIHVYGIGSCMNKALITTEANYLSHDSPEAVDFKAEPDAKEFMLYRMFTGREQIGKSFPVKLTVSKYEDERPIDSLALVMNSECVVYTENL